MTTKEEQINPEILQKAVQLHQERSATDIQINSVHFLSELEHRSIALRIILSTTPQNLNLDKNTWYAE